jgi:hypothetical protein
MLLDWNCVWHQWYELLHQLGVAGQQQIVASFCENGNHMCLSRIQLLRWCETMKGLYQDKVCGDWELLYFLFPMTSWCWKSRFDLLLTHKDDLGRIMTLEQGKPLAEAIGEVLFHSLGISLFLSSTQLLNSLCISWVASHQLEEGYYFGMYGAKSATVNRLPTVQVLWSCMQKKQNVSVGISYLHHI